MADSSMALVVAPENGVDAYRMSTNAATLCGEIVKATATKIQGKRYVCVEGWLAIAAAHGCLVSIRDVESVEGGIRAVAELRRIADQALLATGEGFVGDDEQMWAKRPMFARRAMAQTRASSRVCRSAFAHVVILIDKDLGTTPAEEMHGVIDHEPNTVLNAGSRSIEQAREDIVAQTGDSRSVYQIGKEKKGAAAAKTWADTAIETLKLSSLPSEVDEWQETNGKWLDRLEANHPDEYRRVMDACAAERERCSAKVAA